MSEGYLYVLMNPSMKDTLKIGKTTRDPEQRAEELSSPTGVAEKFIVAYYEYFQDCEEAERYVHTMLEEEGYRTSENREFFEAPLPHVIKVLFSAPGKISNEGKFETEDNDDFELSSGTETDDEIDDLTLDNYEPPNPWDHILEQADDAYYGRGEQLQDYEEALKLYKKAASLGSTKAFKKIGTMYCEGRGTREDKKQALKFWKEGAKKGNYECYAEMTSLFIEYGHKDNAIKCFNKYIDGILENPKDWNDGNVDNFGNIVVKMGEIQKLADVKNIALPVNKKILKLKDEIKKAESLFVDELKRGYEEGYVDKEIMLQTKNDLLPNFKKLLQV